MFFIFLINKNNNNLMISLNTAANYTLQYEGLPELRIKNYPF